MKFFASIFLGLAVCAAAVGQNSLRVGSQAPEFTATDVSGNAVALSELRGKVVVLTFWGTRCPICHEEIPKLNQVARGFGGKNVVFLSLATESDDAVGAYLKRTPMTPRVLPNSFGVLLQYADKDSGGNMNFGFPAYFVINQQGTLQYRASGWAKTPAISATVSKLLSSM
jgi:peroxiredoxin